MITVRLYTGQTLTFPDGTEESVMRGAIDRVLAGQVRHDQGPAQAEEDGADFSAVTSRASSTAPSPRPDPRLSMPIRAFEPDPNRTQSGTTLSLPISQRKNAPPDISVDTPDFSSVIAASSSTAGHLAAWWRSVTGSDDPQVWERTARTATLARAESGGAQSMARLGFQDHETYYENPETGERFPKHHRSGAGPVPLDPKYRPSTAADHLRAAYEMEGRPVPAPEEHALDREFVRGVPGRVAASEAGMLLPLEVASAGAHGLVEEVRDLATGRAGQRPAGEGFRRGLLQGWEGDPMRLGAEALDREVVAPDRERLIEAALRAGRSPLAAAGIDTGQAVVGEALNPGNWIAPETVIEGLRGADRLSPATVRALEIESRGGARTLDDGFGVVAREYGRGSASSELAQRRLARDLAVPREPLIYLDRGPDMSALEVPARGVLGPVKGRIPDALGELLDRPWRHYDESIPIERPTSQSPRPRSVDRDPLPLPETMVHPLVSDEGIKNVAGLWDYASRRYPAAAAQVKRIKITPADAYFDLDTGELAIPPDADLGIMMHEMTHAMQGAWGQEFPGTFEQRAMAAEPYSIRAEEVYRRAAQPPPRELSPGEIAAIRGPYERVMDDFVSGGIRGARPEGPPRGLEMGTRAGDGLVPLTDRELYDARLNLDIQPTGSFRPDEGRAFTAWLEKNGMDPEHVERFGEAPDLERRFFDTHNPEPEPLPGEPVPPSVFRARGEAPVDRPADQPSVGRFWTAKGSLYEVHPDGTTTRNKAPRLEHPDSGPQPRSATTFYVTSENARILGEVQARGARRDLVLSQNGRAAGMRYLEGPSAGQIERRTVVPVEQQPAPGLVPVELWEGRSPHFGNEIVDAAPGDFHRPIPGAGLEPELRGPEYTARDQTTGHMRPEDVAPPNYGIARRAHGIEVTEPSGRVRAFRGPTAEMDASAWLDRENDRLLSTSAIDERAAAAWEAENPRTEPDPTTRTYSPEIDAEVRLAHANREAERLGLSPGIPARRPGTDPFRLGARPPAPAPVPLPEEQVAEAMGWRIPDGSPRAVADPQLMDEFQTNLAAQLGWPHDPAAAGVADYITRRSDEVFRAIGPPQSWDTLEEMASRLGTTKEQFLSDSSHWNVLAPEARLRLLYVIKGNEATIGDLQGKLVAGALDDAGKTELLRAIGTRGDLIQLGAKSGTAYGRALNSLKIEARLALGEDHMLRQQLYRKYAKQLDAEKPLVDALARLNPGDQDELQAFLRHVDKPTFRQYMQEFWVASILSSPASHERNLIGNSINAVLENAVVRPVAAGWDAARVGGNSRSRQLEFLTNVSSAKIGNASTQARRILGELAKGESSSPLNSWQRVDAEARRVAEKAFGPMPPEREVFLRETPAAIVGLGHGLRTGLRRGLEVLRRGYDPESMSGKLFPVRSAFARSQNRVVRDVVGPFVTMPLRLLSASDAVAKTMNWTAEVYAQAARAAAKEGLSGAQFASRVVELVASPTDDMIQAAGHFALKATFNDETSAIGKAIANLRDIPNAQSTNRALQAGIETYRTGMGFMLPFIHIADRLMVRGLEYSPLSAITAAGARRAGNMAEAADLAARASIGSLVMAYGASLAMEGRLTGAAPENEGERAAFYGAGKQPWSVRTDSGAWIPFGQLQPIGTPLALAASFWKGWSEHGEAPDTERLGHAAAQIGSYITDQSYLAGLSRTMNVLSGSELTAGRSFSDAVANTAWGFVPYSGLVRTIARGVDPRVIDARTVSDRLAQNVPGASLGLLGKLDPWGEEIVPTGGRLRTVLASGTVMLPSQEHENPLDEELGRLGMPLGYVGGTLSDHKKQVKLAPEEKYLYQQTAGRATKLLLQNLFAKEGYPDLDTEAQREEVTKAIGVARKYARIVVLRAHNGKSYLGLDPSLGIINTIVESDRRAG